MTAGPIAESLLHYAIKFTLCVADYGPLCQEVIISRHPLHSVAYQLILVLTFNIFDLNPCLRHIRFYSPTVTAFMVHFDEMNMVNIRNTKLMPMVPGFKTIVPLLVLTGRKSRPTGIKEKRSLVTVCLSG